MKIIDLLNKIANGEEIPKKIKYDGIEYKITKIMLEDNKYWENYINEDMECLFPINTNYLNDEVEIIEEEPRNIEVCGSLFTKSEYDKLAYCGEEKKIPKKLGVTAYADGNIAYSWSKSEALLKTKINEIIDYLESQV